MSDADRRADPLVLPGETRRRSLLQQLHPGYSLMRGAFGPQVLLAVAHPEHLQDIKNHAAQ